MSVANWETEVASNPDVGQTAMGHLSVTGTATVTTGLANAITSCHATLEVVSATALHGFVCSCAPGGTPGQIVINVYDSTGAAATTAVTVSWSATDV